MLCIIIIITHTLTQYMRGIDGDDLRQLKSSIMHKIFLSLARLALLSCHNC